MKLFSRLRKRCNRCWQRVFVPSARVGERFTSWRGVWVTTPAIAGLVIALRLTGSLQILEWAALDQFFRLRPVEPRDDRIVIVGITEDDLRRMRRSIISDRDLALLLRQIKRQQPVAIGLDIARDLPEEPGHQELNQLFQSMQNLVGIEFLASTEAASIAPPPALKQKHQVGFINIVVDTDERLRRAVLYLPGDSQNPPQSLGMKLALMYLQRHSIHSPVATPGQEFQLGRAQFSRFRGNDGAYVNTQDEGFQILLNFRGAAGKSFPMVSLFDVLDGHISPTLMRDRIVLIGYTATSKNDNVSTPYSGNPVSFLPVKPAETPEQIAGVEVHAHVTSQLISSALDGRSGIRVWGEPLEWLWVMVWSAMGAVASWSLRSRRWSSVVVLLAGAGLVGICYTAWLWAWWLPLIPPLLAMGSAAAVLTAYIARQEQADRQIVMSLFERHVTREIAEEIWRDRKQFLQQGRLPGRRMVATVLFADLKNFTPIAEQHDPELLMLWLNEYLDAMAQIVVAHGGVVDKFIGDSVMAVFGVPIPHTSAAEITRDAQQAVEAAIVMAKRLEQLNHQWQRQGLPTVTMRIGISTGAVVTGSLGGLQKLDYTTVGDTVNIAARLEAHDKSFRKTLRVGVCRILISAETYDRVYSVLPSGLIQFMDRVKLRGRDQETSIYQVFYDALNPDQKLP